MPNTASGFYFPDASSSMSFESQMAQAASSQQSVINDLILAKRQEQTYKWDNATDRLAQTGMTEGDMGFQRDNDSMWYYNGSQWVVINKAGTSRVVPTSVTGAGVSFNTDTGNISITSSTGGGVRGVFTSAFRSYRIEFSWRTFSASGVSIQLTSGGTASTTGYDRQRLAGVGTTSAASQVINGSSWDISALTTIIGLHRCSLDIDNPALASSTFAHSNANGTENPMVAGGTSGVAVNTFLHRPATSYDGFSFMVASGNIDGQIRVYGYA